MLTVGVLPSTNGIYVVIRPNTVSMAVAAGGLAIAALLDDDARREPLGHLKKAKALADDLVMVEKRGFAVLFRAVSDHTRVAVPMFDARDRPVDVVGIAASAGRLHQKRAEQLRRALVEQCNDAVSVRSSTRDFGIGSHPRNFR